MELRRRMARWLFELDLFLPARDLLMVMGLFFARIALNVMDLVGVALFSFLIGASATGKYPEVPGNAFGILPEGALTQNGAVTVAIVVLTIFVLKSLLAVANVYIATRYAADLEAKYSSQSLEEILSKGFHSIDTHNPEHFQLMFTRGARGRVGGLLTSKLDLAGEAGLFIILSSAMVIISPFIGFSVLLYLFCSLWILLSLVLKNVKKQQEKVLETERKSLEALRNFSSILTELKLSDSSVRHSWANRIFQIRRDNGRGFSSLRVLQAAPRYALEVLALFGMVALVGFSVLFSSLEELGAELGFALGALFRIGTSLVPIQSALQFLHAARVDAALSYSGISIESKIGEERVVSATEDNDPIHELTIPSGTKFLMPNSKQLVFVDEFCAQRGQIVAIVGPSGIGKTSLLTALLESISSDANFQNSIGFCPQAPALVPGTLLENVLLKEDSDLAMTKKARSLLDSLGLDEKEFVRLEGPGAQRISGGQLLRVGIARAALGEPSIILLDEPSSALDSDSSDSIVRWIQEEFKGVAVVVSHDRKFMDVASKVYLVEAKNEGLTLSLRR